MRCNRCGSNERRQVNEHFQARKFANRWSATEDGTRIPTTHYVCLAFRFDAQFSMWWILKRHVIEYTNIEERKTIQSTNKMKSNATKNMILFCAEEKLVFIWSITWAANAIGVCVLWWCDIIFHCLLFVCHRVVTGVITHIHNLHLNSTLDSV